MSLEEKVGKRIVLCGSMTFLNCMREWKEKLEAEGYRVDMPTPVDFHAVRDEEGNLEAFEEIKRRETKNHFDRVREADIVLVLNYDKNGKPHYIGGNTFAEIAYAVALRLCHNKQIEIYAINPLPKDSMIYEELSAWQVCQWNYA